MELAYAISVFVAIFAIANPIGIIPFFTAITRDYSLDEQRQVATKAIAVATGTLIIFALVGRYIFLFFSITIPAFRIAGGILLFSVAFTMLFGAMPGTKTTEAEKRESIEREDVGITPMGIPMIAGPGTISTVMLFISRGDLGVTLVVLGSVLIIMGLTYFCLTNADRIFARMGKVGALAISRIMGLILATVAIQFLINGAHEIALEWLTELQAVGL
jgi:multiple antibiotic resistance protein